MGTLTTYLLATTGRDHAAIKGAGAATFAWVMLNGFIGSQLLKQKSKTSTPPILGFLDHVISGTICGLLVSKLEDDSLFPVSKELNHG